MHQKKAKAMEIEIDGCDHKYSVALLSTSWVAVGRSGWVIDDCGLEWEMYKKRERMQRSVALDRRVLGSEYNTHPL